MIAVMSPAALARKARWLRSPRRALFGSMEVFVVGVAIVLAVPTVAQAVTVEKARGKPATASSTYTGLPASNGNDGSMTTRWSSTFSDGQWWRVDLGQPEAISQIKIDWEAAYCKNYRFQRSPDATTWTTVVTVTNNKKAGWLTYTFTEVTDRHWRMLCDLRGTQYGASFWELEAWGTQAPPPTPTPTPTPTPPPGDDPGLSDGVLFSPSSFMNTPIDPAAPLDPRNSAIMADFNARVGTNGQVTWTRYGQPLYMLTDTEAKGAATVRYSIDQTRYPDPKRYLRNVPIPVGAAPDPGDDGYMTIIDDRPASPTYGCNYDVFEASTLGPSGSVWAASAASRKIATNDDGNYKPGQGSGPRGSSFAPALGELRPEEIATGIHHALVFAYGHNYTEPAVPSYHSDGAATDSPYTTGTALPEGARIRLKAATNLSGLSAGWQSIGQALKTYGAFNVDNGGTNPPFAIGGLNNTASPLTWGYGIAWPWANSETYPVIPAVILQNFELMDLTPQTEVQETPPVTHSCGDYADTP